MARGFRLIGASIVAAGIAAACDKAPLAPTPAGGNPVPAATATRLEIVGPHTLAPGGTSQYKAMVYMSDGTSRDVTSLTSWKTSNVDLVVSTPGLVTARNRGDATLSAAYDGLSSIVEVIAVPDGTFRLIGHVMESVAPRGYIADALVEVTDGTTRGLVSRTDAGGHYRLYGVSGDIELRVTKDGYTPHIQRLSVTEHQVLDIGLEIFAMVSNITSSRRGPW